jgi:hypothetical protein
MRFRSTLADVEAALNQVNDSEREWWPFGFLRPEPEERLSSPRVALLSLLQAVPAVLLVVVLASLTRGPLHRMHLGAFLAVVCASVFAFHRCTFAFFWNRRAERLALLETRRRAWREKRWSRASD